MGLNQETGFNSEAVKVSLFSRLTANLDQLAVTYALLLLGGLCCLFLLYRIQQHEQLTALVAWTGRLRISGLRNRLRVDRRADVLHSPAACVLCLIAVLTLYRVRLAWVGVAFS